MNLKTAQPESKKSASWADARPQSLLVARTPGQGGEAASLLRLQHTHGNRFVQRLLALARKAEGQAEAAPDIENTIQSARGNGHPLDNNLRAQMEAAFGASFIGVRIHTDPEANTLNQALNARAFTTGQDIFFRRGEYNPGSSIGRELLAHELTHVVQQAELPIQRKFVVGEPGDQYEQEADRVAQAVMRMLESGSPPEAAISPGGGVSGIQRMCSECEEEMQRKPATIQRSLVKHCLAAPVVQRAWSQGGSTDTTGGSAWTSGNGDIDSRFLTHGVFASAEAWQTKKRWEWCIDGGTASVSKWKATQYTFRHDGTDNDFLEVTIAGDLSGNAKAQDLHFAKSGAVVIGLVKVRTPSSPTPTSTELFRIKDGGKSAANVSTVADIELTIPIDGSVTVRIPLTAVSEGVLSAYSEAVTPPVSQNVSGSIGSETIVDLYLAARVEATADIESTCVPENPTDINSANGIATYRLVRWADRAAPATVSPTPSATGTPGATGSTASGNRVRVQLQSGSTNIDSVTLSESRPITVSEGQRAVDTLIDRQSSSINRACSGAGTLMNRTIARYPPNGVSCPPSCGNVARKWCDAHSDYPRGIRLDLENNAGTNFQS